MKRLLIIAAIFFLTAVAASADQRVKVKLDDNHQKEVVHFGPCNVFVTRTGVDDDDIARVSIEIENLDETSIIILFDHAHTYSEKQLKKRPYSMTFDKNFPGTKGQRDIDTYSGTRKILYISPQEKIMLPDISVISEGTQLCRIPMYIAKYKERKFLGIRMKSNKKLLIEKPTLELELEADIKPDADYVRIEKKTNDLIEEIARQTFCTNTRHRPSLERQEAPYKKRIGEIKEDIDKILASHADWYSSGRAYQRYASLKQKLEAIDFSNYERDCGKKHGGAAQPACKYCQLTPQQIYHKLDDYYKKIYSSSNRKAAKDAVMSDVNLLYSCGKHSPAWQNSEYNSKIIDRYNRINNF